MASTQPDARDVNRPPFYPPPSRTKCPRPPPDRFRETHLHDLIPDDSNPPYHSPHRFPFCRGRADEALGERGGWRGGRARSRSSIRVAGRTCRSGETSMLTGYAEHHGPLSCATGLRIPIAEQRWSVSHSAIVRRRPALSVRGLPSPRQMKTGASQGGRKRLPSPDRGGQGCKARDRRPFLTLRRQ